MYHNRLIPCLLLDHGRLVKTQQFKKPRYVGDPLNAVRIYNDREVDELIFLDIRASAEKRHPDFEYLQKITAQCFMPLCYGGGVSDISDVRELFKIGFEKVSINASAYKNITLLTEAAEVFGSQSIVGAMDVSEDKHGRKTVKILNGKKNLHMDPTEYAKRLEAAGAGEILVNSITHDGEMNGYDLELIKSISSAVSVPVIACGGAKNIEDCKKVCDAGASAAAAGSMFVFWGRNRAVLINYPDQDVITGWFEE